MPTDTSEKNLESLLVAHLRDVQGYEEGTTADYHKGYALDCARVKRFLLETQPEKVKETSCFASEVNERRFFTLLAGELERRGVTDVLRRGVRYLAARFDLYYPLPSELSPLGQQRYAQNIFCVTRQLFFSQQSQESIDVMISLNGLPVLTLELKNSYTEQGVKEAKSQYCRRNPHEPLLRPKRCAVHLAVSDVEVEMCTTLCGKPSWFLPFNQGVNGGAGNPVNPSGPRTAYLWEQVLRKESLSDILEHYAQVLRKTDPKTQQVKESVVWPRYHQLHCVRRLLAATRQGLGQRFLIQHSAGSGKSNSITWLAYQLAAMLQGTQPLLDSVVVVTDSRILDQQIRDNIHAFGRMPHLVGWAEDSEELKNHLESGKRIIITTVHKFPFILDAIGGELKHRRFAIIIDEAHSSQTGKMSASMSIALNGEAGSDETDMDDRIAAIIEGRKMVTNANYYAFTATPKNKTLEMFGTPFLQPDGETGHRPFHEYTMKQAIEEGFIMDVLEHYTTYDSLYRVVRATADNPLFDRRDAQKKLRAFVEGHPDTVAKKAAIIVEHFHQQVIGKGKVGGQARAMVVTSGIGRAISLYHEITRLLMERRSPYRAIVAFSGQKEYEGRMVTEADVNGFPSAEIERRIEQDPYRLLVVADKFQTGYDQPLLHTMYVDKVLADVKAVQTLSRLNRCHPQKRDTFVLDFANTTDDIQRAFQRYYKTTILSKETDPNKLNRLLAELEDACIYTDEEVQAVNQHYWSGAPREQLDPLVDTAVERFKQLDEKTQISTKGSMRAFLRTYPFIAAVTPLKSVEWEMLHTYFSLLITKLPVLRGEDLNEGLLEAINFDKYQPVKNQERSIELENHDAEIDPIPISAGGGQQQPEMARLSDILDEWNTLHFSNPDLARQQLDQLPERASNDAAFVNAARNSNRETAFMQFTQTMMGIVASMLNENTEFCRHYLDNADFRNAVNMRAFEQSYSDVVRQGSTITIENNFNAPVGHYIEHTDRIS